jgi:hypothetical protein
MKININSLKDKEGRLDEKKVLSLIEEKPLFPAVSKEKLSEFSVKLNRDRLKSFPKRLPTGGLMPLPVDEHEHIGMYENNQTLYLTIANAYNELVERIEILEERLKGEK